MNNASLTHVAEMVELPELGAQKVGATNVLENSLNLLSGVQVKVSVAVGEIHTTLGDLMSIKEKSILKIERPVDQPIDLIVNGNIVARGQLVVVDDNFGVRITEIAAQK